MKHVVIIGAGAGGLSASIDLARQGLQVSVFDKAEQPGGKMRQLQVNDTRIDAGPTVFTMRWVFDELFDRAGAQFGKCLEFKAADILARHAWTSGGTLDLFADRERSRAAIKEFSDEQNLSGFDAFSDRSALIYETLKTTFMAKDKPNPLSLTKNVGLGNIGKLLKTAPHRSLWGHLGDYFSDLRLRQLFARYATYVGSSPLQCPATLMLIAHVEQDGVWLLPGGMRSLAGAMQKLGEQCGAHYRFSTGIQDIQTRGNQVAGVTLESGEYVAADAIVFNGDQAALSSGLLGTHVDRAAPRVKRKQRGLSAVTWCIKARTSGFPLHYHNVFFDDDYPGEFRSLFQGRELPEKPTVYVCAQDRVDGHLPQATADRPERLLILVNAPADGDRLHWDEASTQGAWESALRVMTGCGLTIELAGSAVASTTPSGFANLFPGTGGSLYGRASHGMFSSFQRPGARSSIKGLYLAGGSVHPGPGVPMATLSGALAAAAVSSDFARQ